MNGVSKIFRPLNDLMVGNSSNKSERKKDTFEGGKAQDTAFKAPPVLVYRYYCMPFKLHTDALTSGLGVDLYKEQNDI